MTVISTLLLVAIGLRFMTDYWLDQRQIAYVQARQNEVPPHFADRVTPEEHRKAAAYTIARVRSKVGTQVLRPVLLIILIFEGKFAALQSAVAVALGTGYLASLALAGALAFIYSLVAAQTSYHQTFSIEARFGFNNSSRWLFIMDLLKSWGIGLAFLVPIVLGID